MFSNRKIKTLAVIAIVTLLITAVLVMMSVRLYVSGSTEQSTNTMQEVHATTQPAETEEPLETSAPVWGEPELAYDGVDSTLFNHCEREGQNIEIYYTTRDYVYGSGEYEKRMVVYLPYGYSSENSYNVLVLLHGLNGTEDYWLSELRPYVYRGEESTLVYLKDMLDNMHVRGWCEPTIVVSFTYYLNDSARENEGDTQRDADQISCELVYDILPYIAENYGTYAEGGSREQLAAARNHFGFMGASYGAMLMMRGPLCENLDVFSYFGNISGNSTSAYYITERWSSNGFSEIPINFFYFGSGSDDRMRSETEAIYNEMRAAGLKIDDENSCYVETVDAVHEDRVWCNGLYNCLIKFFK